jgi:hypothetical protein
MSIHKLQPKIIQRTRNAMPALLKDMGINHDRNLAISRRMPVINSANAGHPAPHPIASGLLLLTSRMK